MSDEKKSYDTQDKFSMHFARLTKDAETKTIGDRQVVELTIVSESRFEKDSPMWIIVEPSDFQADLGVHLKKGDVIGVEGKLTMRRYGESQEKVAFSIRRADLKIPPSLFGDLKERGFTPGAGKAAAKPLPKKAPPAKRAVVDLDDE